MEREKPQGVIVQLGGQTPLKLARGLAARGVPILGTPPDAIDLRRGPRAASATCSPSRGSSSPRTAAPRSLDEAREVAARIGYPVVVRPSYVLGGRAMAVVYDGSTLERYMAEAAGVSPGHPVLIDRFLEDAFEVDLDADLRRQDAPSSPASSSTSRRRASTPATRRAVLPPYKVSPEDQDRDARHRPPAGAAAGRRRPDERAVRHQGRQDLRPGGQPARLTHRAVRRQGHGVPLAKIAAASWRARR